MRKKIMHRIVLSIVLVYSTSSYCSEYPEDFKPQMADQMSQAYCSDGDFLQCLSLSLIECESDMRKAVENCDYRPMWSEFERKENAGTEYSFDRTVTNAIGACVGDGFREGINVADAHYDQCMSDYFERFKAKNQAHVREREE